MSMVKASDQIVVDFPIEAAEQLQKNTVVAADGCVTWTSKLVGAGQAVIIVQGVRVQARRAAWILTYGVESIPGRVLMSCSNHLCVKAEHISGAPHPVVHETEAQRTAIEYSTAVIDFATLCRQLQESTELLDYPELVEILAQETQTFFITLATQTNDAVASLYARKCEEVYAAASVVMARATEAYGRLEQSLAVIEEVASRAEAVIETLEFVKNKALW